MAKNIAIVVLSTGLAASLYLNHLLAARVGQLQLILEFLSPR